MLVNKDTKLRLTVVSARICNGFEGNKEKQKREFHGGENDRKRREGKGGFRPLGKLFPLTTFRRECCSGGGQRWGEEQWDESTMRLCGGFEVRGGFQSRGMAADGR
jgi:hypothetical protein